MTAVRVVVGLSALVGVATVLASVLRTVVVPRADPAILARVAFLSVLLLLHARLRVTGRSDYAARDRVFALEAPLGLFAQLLTWALMIFLLFAALFWALSASPLDGGSISRALELSGSSMLTLGFDSPHGLARQLTAFATAGVGLTLLALVITYLPTLYAAFSRREALITKLAVRVGVPPAGPALISSSWKLGRFDQLEEVWNSWEDWFIDIGESHTSFPQLPYFRSHHPYNHWVVASEAVLDGSALFITACDTPRQSRSELCLRAGVHSLISISDFLGIPHGPPEPNARIVLPQERFEQAFDELGAIGVPMVKDRSAAWAAFRPMRARYEPLLAALGRMTDAPRSDWISWSDDTPRHRPPLLGSNSRTRGTDRRRSANAG
jgi:hypothetical protein